MVKIVDESGRNAVAAPNGGIHMHSHDFASSPPKILPSHLALISLVCSPVTNLRKRYGITSLADILG